MNVCCKHTLTIGMMLLVSGSVFAQQTPKPTTKAMQANPAAEQALQDAGALMQAGKFQEAEPLLARAAKLAPSSPVPHNLLGYVYEQLKDPAKAEPQ